MTALVVALNPSIDAEWRVTDVLWEEKNNVRSERRWAGGKGINVARWLRHLGGKPLLLVPLGGITGEELDSYLQGEKIPTRIVPLKGATRVNVIITTDAGRQMRFNPAGPELSAGEWRRIVAGIKRELARTDLLILSGSLPRGVPADAYAQLLRLAHRAGVKTLLDCDGAPLAAAVSEKPFLVKPNEHELAGWFGKPLRTESAVRQAATALSKRTGGWVLVSRGGQRSLLLHAGEAFELFGRPERVKPQNTVGAGDALLAAVAHQILGGTQPEAWLAAGLATGTAATQCLPGMLPAKA